MKKFIITSLVLFVAIAAIAQESSYVYAQLHWRPTATKGYVAHIQMGPEFKDVPILDENGEKLSFFNLLHALNYMSLQGWELVQLSPENPDNSTFSKEQYALIRKKMSIEEAQKYSTPKEK